jgi:tRNA threonylcarbamoyladenosine biosynthesis protein TsaB
MLGIRKILAFDTAMTGCSVAIFDSKTGNSTSEIRRMERGQAEALVPMIQELLQKAGASFDEIDLIAVTKGPGAFTGLRIGLSTARALGVALNKPVTGLITLDVISYSYLENNKLTNEEQLCVLIETKRQDFYAQIFSADGKAVSEPLAATHEEISDMLEGGRRTVLIGDACQRFAAACDNQDNLRIVKGYELPDPIIMAKIVLSQDLFESDTVEPLYLRGADVSRPKRAARVLAE